MNTKNPPAFAALRIPTDRRDLAAVDSTPKPRFDAALLRRYPDLRPYVCYPGMERLAEDFGEQELRAQVARSNSELIPRQLSLHVHIPYCLERGLHCSGHCRPVSDSYQPRIYVENLCREIAALGALFDRDRDVVELQLGQGALELEQAHDLMETLGRQFHFDQTPSRSFSITLNPHLTNAADIASYRALGLNRALLGVSLAEQNLREVIQTIERCRAHGFRSIKIDIFGDVSNGAHPGLGRALNQLLAVKPERLMVRNLAEHSYTELLAACEQLYSAGYVYLGLGDFALPTDDSVRAQHSGRLRRSFNGYTTHGDCDVVGLGVSAFSYIADSICQNTGELRQWETALDQGKLPVARGLKLGLDDVIRADVIQQILCEGSIDVATIEDRYYIDFCEWFADALHALQPFIEDRLMERDEAHFRVTSRGHTILSIIAACFDKYARTF